MVYFMSNAIIYANFIKQIARETRHRKYPHLKSIYTDMTE